MHIFFWDYIKEKWAYAGFQKYFRNMGWMFAGKIFTLILSFFVSIYMARNLGVENFGTLNFVISFASIAGISIFTINSILLRKLNHEPENTEKILGSAFIINIINALLTIITATVASLIFANNQTTTILVFSFSTFAIFQTFSGTIDPYFQAHAKIKKVTQANIITSIISAIVKIGLISFNVNIIYLLLSYVFDHFIAAISYIYIYQKYIGKIFNWKIDKNTIKNFIVNSWPFTISAIATSIYIRADQIFLKLLLGSKAVGSYVVAVRFSEVWFIIPAVICASLLPAILNAQKTNQEIFFFRSKKMYSLLFYSSLLICAFIFISAPFIIKTLYGTDYIQSISLLRIYVWSIIGVFISTALQQFLLAQNKFKTILLLNVIGMTLSLILNSLFIPIWGIKGAAITNIFAYTLPVIVILSLKDMKDQKLSFISAVFKPFS
ncbi:MAG: flippase [Patescibacteria group bacterium]